MFELGRCNVEQEKLGDHNLTYIYNFWQNPESIVQLLSDSESDLYWKLKCLKEEERGRILSQMSNGVFFEDRRHDLEFSEIKHAHNFVSSLINTPHNIQNSCGYGRLMTNVHKIYDVPFNDFRNNWWSPHKDGCPYACIWYFNKDDDINGTNIYEQTEQIDCDNSISHYTDEVINPWVPKKFFKRIKLLKPVYNSAVIFSGQSYFHGMNIENNRYSNEYRINSVLFIQ